MIILTLTTDKISMITSSAASIDYHSSFIDHTLSTDNFLAGRKNGNVASAAATTTIVDVPTAGDTRNAKFINIRNKSASTACDITVQFDQSATLYELCKFTLNAGELLTFVEGTGWFVTAALTKLDVKLRTSADVINATTSWADISGLSCLVESGKHYGFDAKIYHIENASSTGFRLGVNGPTMTALRVGGATIFAGSITAATQASALSDTAALDTSVTGATTTSANPVQVVPATIHGWFNPSAAGTFVIRCQSEIAVAAGVTIKQGSWCRVWEFDN